MLPGSREYSQREKNVPPQRDPAKTVHATIHSFPRDGIAYLECLKRAMRNCGAPISASIFSASWVIKNVRRDDICLFHWPSFSYARDNAPISSIFAALRFFAILLIIKARKSKVAWVAHNLLPHKPTPPLGLDYLVRRALIRLSNAVLVHGDAVSHVVTNHFPSARGKTVAIVHGHFRDLYPRSSKTREEHRREMGIPESSFLFLCFGSLQPYKGFHFVPEAIKIECVKNKLEPWLLIAGPCSSDDYFSQLRTACQIHLPDRSTIRRGYVPDESISGMIHMADAIVLPYAESLTSGASLLAMSFGRPVVAPRTPFLSQTVDETCGLLYEPDSPESLPDALWKVTQLRFNEDQIISKAEAFDWESTVKIIRSI